MASLAEQQNAAIFGREYSGQDAYLNLREFLPLIGSRKYRSALDIGCGNGAIACGVAAALGAEVTGIDASPQAIRVARQNAFLSQTDGRTTFHVLDMDRLTPRVIAAHDLIFSLDALQHSRDLASLMSLLSARKQQAAVVAGSLWCVSDERLAIRWGFPKAHAPAEVVEILERTFPMVFVSDYEPFGERLAAHHGFVTKHDEQLRVEIGDAAHEERLLLLEDSQVAIARGDFRQLTFSTLGPAAYQRMN